MAYVGVPQSKLGNQTTNVQIVNLSASFDGTTVTFNLQDSRGDAVYAIHERALLVTLGGVTQNPGVDYTTSGTTITFTTAPVSNLSIQIRKLYGAQRIIGVNDGVISPVKLSTGGPVWNSSGNVTISGDLNVTGAFNSGGNGLFWEDNEKANFGSNNDLEIYHSGVNSFIRDSGTGSLFIEGTDLTLRAADSTTRYLVANESNGDVSLFFGNNKKFETTAQGISVTGDINGAGNFTLTSTNVGSTAAPEINLFRNSTSPADLDYLGQIKFTGKQDGGGTVNYAKITGKILDASDGTEDGILEFMLRKAGSDNIAARFRSDSFQLLNGTGLTVNGTTTLSGDLSLDDDVKANFGAGDDLQIWSDNTDQYIRGEQNQLLIRSNNLKLQSYLGENYIHAANNNAVSLYYDNSKKLETTTTGVSVTGSIQVSQEYPTIRPTLDLNFAATKTLDRRITFTRDSIGTFTGEDGLVKYASNNVPRFDHDPTTGESLGLLIEESRTNNNKVTNLAVDGMTTANGWTLARFQSPEHYTSETSPDGLNNSTLIAPDTQNFSHYAYPSWPGDTLTGSRTISCWFKNLPTTIYYPQLRIIGTGSEVAHANFTLSGNGTISSGGSSITGATITPYPNGWYRCTLSWNHSDTHYGGGIVVSNSMSSELPSFAGDADNTKGFLAWGYQDEAGAFATSLIPTSGSAVTRGADNAKITGTNFTDFYNSSASTLFMEGKLSGTTSTGQYPFVALEVESNNNRNNSFAITRRSTQGIRAVGYDSSGTQDLDISNSTSWDGGSFRKFAFALDNSGSSSVLVDDGTIIGTDASYVTTSLSSVDILRFGEHKSGGMTNFNITIKSFKYYNKRLPNAQLQGLTQQ